MVSMCVFHGDWRLHGKMTTAYCSCNTPTQFSPAWRERQLNSPATWIVMTTWRPSLLRTIRNKLAPHGLLQLIRISSSNMFFLMRVISNKGKAIQESAIANHSH